MGHVLRSVTRSSLRGLGRLARRLAKRSRRLWPFAYFLFELFRPEIVAWLRELLGLGSGG